ncbi:MAG: hypothetical protein LBP76_02150, partial [Treponema sp.]|nr:hypothetical protein [Treponema sp.]
EFVPCYIESVEKAIAELKSPPRWETPEQWKERTGAELPDDFPVWERCVSRYDREPWSLATYDEAKDNIDVHKEYEHSRIEIICATEAGCPPDDWAPEGR